ncbi:uncharacterized protein LOC124930060 [Impatiens glandulifera]|uniref:uncharacterized protein LOC124930060 n=1 Tax=Impatiens glandulifera TaxID=253017 RepID=UPI001FB1402E|nr:uncharacterized protein LOC124930060 [Impatiens glandulifera]
MSTCFLKVKDYLKSPPIFMLPKLGVPLILYLMVTENAMGSKLARENKDKVKVAVYYVSKRMTAHELNCSSVENMCWALACVTKRLKHYMQAHTIKHVSMLDLILFVFQRTAIPKISQVNDDDLRVRHHVHSVVADFLVDNPIDIEEEDDLSFPDDEIMITENDSWRLMFDGV